MTIRTRFQKPRNDRKRSAARRRRSLDRATMRHLKAVRREVSA